MAKSLATVMTSYLCALVLFTSARASPVNVRPVPVAGNTLQNALNAITLSGPGISASNDQQEAALFTSTASGGSLAAFTIQVAASSDTNTFGLYDAANPSNRAIVFDSSSVPGTRKFISFLASGDIRVNGSTVAAGFASPSDFGFFVEVFGAPLGAGGDGNSATLDYTLFTEDNPNTSDPLVNHGEAAALIFQGDDQTVLQVPSLLAGTFSSDEFLIAFDDGQPNSGLGAGTRDYSDLVVLVESITPVPEPATILLMAVGLGVLGWPRRRRR